MSICISFLILEYRSQHIQTDVILEKKKNRSSELLIDPPAYPYGILFIMYVITNIESLDTMIFKPRQMTLMNLRGYICAIKYRFSTGR
jgi:hypothetical protein